MGGSLRPKGIPPAQGAHLLCHPAVVRQSGQLLPLPGQGRRQLPDWVLPKEEMLLQPPPTPTSLLPPTVPKMGQDVTLRWPRDCH